MIGQITFQHGGQTRMITTNHYDPLNRLVWITNQVGAVAVTSAYYTNNLANQRTGVRLLDGSYWVYQYDALGQVQAGNKHWSDGNLVPGQQFGYTNDNIGNRTQIVVGGDPSGGGLRLATYTPNLLNQYESRIGTNLVDITGNANAASTVTVSVGGQATPSVYRHNEYFQAVGAVTNWAGVTVTASHGGTNNTQLGNLLAPPANQTFQYDADGNLTNDTIWSYIWDAENRLVAMDCLVAGPIAQHLRFQYDWLGRRIQKATLDAQTNVITDTRFLYDGWNLLAELDPQGRALRSYLWGLDLSGSPQGAGGVGGLIAVTDATLGSHIASYDGNGNVMALVKATDGSTAARYEYGPFGELVRATGPMAKGNPFRWSTKYTDDETDLVYYGFRFYSASLGRWIRRDPMQEDGGPNLYGFGPNAPLDGYDDIGAAWLWRLNLWTYIWPGANYNATKSIRIPPAPLPGRPVPTYGSMRDEELEDDGVARFFGLKQDVHDCATFLLELTPQNTVSVVVMGESLGGEQVGTCDRIKRAAMSGPGLFYFGGKLFKVSGAVLKKLRGKTSKEILSILKRECCVATNERLTINGFTLARHRDMPTPRLGAESHHGAMTKWMELHYPNYDPKKAPAILMPEAAHNATRAVYNRWRAEMRRDMGGQLDWSRISEQDMRALSDKMFRESKTPKPIQNAYWQWFEDMKASLAEP